jgi:hypothetical protein
MASTYSSLKIELIGTGEQTNTWGSTTNVNLGTAIEEAIAESADVSFSSANVTLTLTNSNSSQTARNVRLNLTGTSGGARTLTVPDIEKPYIINNGLADTVTVQNSTGTTVAVPAGKTMWVYSTGAGVKDVTTHATSMTLGTALAAASGGTGLTSPGTNGNVLTSNGTAWTSAAPPEAFSAGMIMLWSGSIASIPSGWALCNGSNGTPDLRDRFVVGAGSTYAVDATGGSADAIVVSHSHSATTSVSLSDPGHSHTITNARAGNPNGGGPNYAGADGGGQSVTVPSNTTGITVQSATTTVASSGSSGTNANLPPYYALAYIMKT